MSSHNGAAGGGIGRAPIDGVAHHRKMAIVAETGGGG
jgi:hypothetical protein